MRVQPSALLSTNGVICVMLGKSDVITKARVNLVICQKVWWWNDGYVIVIIIWTT